MTGFESSSAGELWRELAPAFVLPLPMAGTLHTIHVTLDQNQNVTITPDREPVSVADFYHWEFDPKIAFARINFPPSDELFPQGLVTDVYPQKCVLNPVAPLVVPKTAVGKAFDYYLAVQLDQCSHPVVKKGTLVVVA